MAKQRYKENFRLKQWRKRTTCLWCGENALKAPKWRYYAPYCSLACFHTHLKYRMDNNLKQTVYRVSEQNPDSDVYLTSYNVCRLGELSFGITYRLGNIGNGGINVDSDSYMRRD